MGLARGQAPEETCGWHCPLTLVCLAKVLRMAGPKVPFHCPHWLSDILAACRRLVLVLPQGHSCLVLGVLLSPCGNAPVVHPPLHLLGSRDGCRLASGKQALQVSRRPALGAQIRPVCLPPRTQNSSHAFGPAQALCPAACPHRRKAQASVTCFSQPHLPPALTPQTQTAGS